MISRRACEGGPAGYVSAVTSDPPDPRPETTPGLAPGGSVQPGDTPPIESTTSATNYRQPDLPSERTNWLVIGGLALVVVVVAILLGIRSL
jgi:hypothetical protein